MFWIIVIGVFIAISAISIGVHQSIERVGNSDLSPPVKALIIGGIALAVLVLYFVI